jgi:peptidoglycan hydrolase-like protein with peptidoglycan-binding domain
VKRAAVVTALFAALLAAPGVVEPAFGAPAKTSTAKRAGSKKKSASAARKRTPGRKRAQTSPATPTRERFKELQSALRARGYDPGPIDGQWGARSAAALKRFEKDHDLPADGQLDSLAVITLGLGPARVARVAPPAPKSSLESP